MLILGVLLMASGTSFAKSKNYSVDSDHSSVEFRVKHLAGKVKGRYDISKMEGKVEYDAEKPEKLKITGKIDATTIDTNNQKRDDHLRSPDFFDVNNPNNPQNKWIIFESTKFTEVSTVNSETKGKLEGKLTIHSVTQQVVLNVVIHGKPMVDPWGFERVAISADGSVNRKDFGLTWNQALETGGFLVGDSVSISIEVEAIVKSDSAPKAAKPEEKKVEVKQDKVPAAPATKK